MSNNHNENPIQRDCRTLLLWFTNSLKKRPEGRICRQYAALYSHIAKVSNEEYHPSISNCIAQCITWYIQSTSKRRRKTPEFLEDVKRKLFFLRLYNQSVIKYKGRFPYSEQLVRLLVQYIVLEFEVLFCSPNYDQSLEEEVENRITRNLELILFDSCKHGILTTKTAVDASSVAALKVLTHVKTDHGNENKLYKNIINSLIVKFLKKIGMLTKLEEIVKNKSFTLLQNPVLQSIRQNLIANDYVLQEQFSISDDEYDDSWRSWDKPLGFESPKHEKSKLTNGHKERTVKNGLPNKKAQRRENRCASLQKPTSTNFTDKNISILTIEIGDDDDDDIDEVVYLQPVPQTCKDTNKALRNPVNNNLNGTKPIRHDNSHKQIIKNPKNSRNQNINGIEHEISETKRQKHRCVHSEVEEIRRNVTNKPLKVTKKITSKNDEVLGKNCTLNGQLVCKNNKREIPEKIISCEPSESRIEDIENKLKSLLECHNVEPIRAIDADQTILIIDDHVQSLQQDKSKHQFVHNVENNKQLATSSKNSKAFVSDTVPEKIHQSGENSEEFREFSLENDTDNELDFEENWPATTSSLPNKLIETNTIENDEFQEQDSDSSIFDDFEVTVIESNTTNQNQKHVKDKMQNNEKEESDGCFVLVDDDNKKNHNSENGNLEYVLCDSSLEENIEKYPMHEEIVVDSLNVVLQNDTDTVPEDNIGYCSSLDQNEEIIDDSAVAGSLSEDVEQTPIEECETIEDHQRKEHSEEDIESVINKSIFEKNYVVNNEEVLYEECSNVEEINILRNIEEYDVNSDNGVKMVTSTEVCENSSIAVENVEEVVIVMEEDRQYEGEGIIIKPIEDDGENSLVADANQSNDIEIKIEEEYITDQAQKRCPSNDNEGCKESHDDFQTSQEDSNLLENDSSKSIENKHIEDMTIILPKKTYDNKINNSIHDLQFEDVKTKSSEHKRNSVSFDYQEEAALVESSSLTTEESQQYLEEATNEITICSEKIECEYDKSIKVSENISDDKEEDVVVFQETISSKNTVVLEEQQIEIKNKNQQATPVELDDNEVQLGDNDSAVIEEEINTINSKNLEAECEYNLTDNVEIIVDNQPKSDEVNINETVYEEEEENITKELIIEQNADTNDIDKEITNELRRMEKEAQGINEVTVENINFDNETIVVSENHEENEKFTCKDDGELISETNQFSKIDHKLGNCREHDSTIPELTDAEETTIVTENQKSITNEDDCATTNEEQMTEKSNQESSVVLYVLHQDVAEKDLNPNFVTNVFEKEQPQHKATEIIPVSEKSTKKVEDNRFSVFLSPKTSALVANVQYEQKNYYAEFSSKVINSSTPGYKTKRHFDTSTSSLDYKIYDIRNSSLQPATEDFRTEGIFFKQSFDNSLDVLATAAAERKKLEYGQSDLINKYKENETFEKVTKDNSEARSVRPRRRRKKLTQEPSDCKRITRSCTKKSYEKKEENYFLCEKDIFNSNSTIITEIKQKRKRLKPVKLEYTPNSSTTWSRMRKKHFQNQSKNNKKEDVKSSKLNEDKNEITSPYEPKEGRRKSSCFTEQVTTDISEEAANNFFGVKNQSNSEGNFQKQEDGKMAVTFKNILSSTNESEQKNVDKSKNEICEIDSSKCELDDFTNSGSLSAFNERNEIFAQVAEMSATTDDSNDSYNGGLSIVQYDNDSQPDGLIKGRKLSIYDEETSEEQLILITTAEKVQPIDQLICISIPETENNAVDEDPLLKQVEEFQDNLEQMSHETETPENDVIINSVPEGPSEYLIEEKIVEQDSTNVEESMDAEQQIEKNIALPQRPLLSSEILIDGSSSNDVLNEKKAQTDCIVASSELKEQNVVEKVKVQIGNSFLIENILKPEVPKSDKQNENNVFIDDKAKHDATKENDSVDKSLDISEINNSDVVVAPAEEALDLSLRKEDHHLVHGTESTELFQENENSQTDDDIKMKNEAVWPPKLRSKMLSKKEGDILVATVDEDTQQPIRTKAELKLYDKFYLLPYVRLEKIDVIKEKEAIRENRTKTSVENERKHPTMNDTEIKNTIKGKFEVISNKLRYESEKRNSNVRARSCSSEFKDVNKAATFIENGNFNTFKMTLRTRSKSNDVVYDSNVETKSENCKNNLVTQDTKKERNLINEICYNNILIKEKEGSIKIKESKSKKQNNNEENSLIMHTDNIIKDQVFPVLSDEENVENKCKHNNEFNENQSHETLTKDEGAIEKIEGNVIDQNLLEFNDTIEIPKSKVTDNNSDSRQLNNNDLSNSEKLIDSHKENEENLEYKHVKEEPKQNRQSKQKRKHTNKPKRFLKVRIKHFNAKKWLRLHHMNKTGSSLVKKRINRKYKKAKKFLFEKQSKNHEQTVQITNQKEEKISEVTSEQAADKINAENLEINSAKIKEYMSEIETFDNQSIEENSGTLQDISSGTENFINKDTSEEVSQIIQIEEAIVSENDNEKREETVVSDTRTPDFVENINDNVNKFNHIENLGNSPENSTILIDKTTLEDNKPITSNTQDELLNVENRRCADENKEDRNIDIILRNETNEIDEDNNVESSLNPDSPRNQTQIEIPFTRTEFSLKIRNLLDLYSPKKPLTPDELRSMCDSPQFGWKPYLSTTKMFKTSKLAKKNMKVFLADSPYFNIIRNSRKTRKFGKRSVETTVSYLNEKHETDSLSAMQTSGLNFTSFKDNLLYRIRQRNESKESDETKILSTVNPKEIFSLQEEGTGQSSTFEEHHSDTSKHEENKNESSPFEVYKDTAYSSECNKISNESSTSKEHQNHLDHSHYQESKIDSSFNEHSSNSSDEENSTTDKTNDNREIIECNTEKDKILEQTLEPSKEKNISEVVDVTTIPTTIDQSITKDPTEEALSQPHNDTSEAEMQPAVCNFLKLNDDNLAQTGNKLNPPLRDGFMGDYDETPVPECSTMPTLCGDEISMNFITEITTALTPHVVTQAVTCQKVSSGMTGLCSSVDNLETQPSTSTAGDFDTTQDEQQVEVYWTIQTSSETLDHNYSAGDPLLCGKSKSNNVPSYSPTKERAEARETNQQLDNSPVATETILPFQEVCIDSVIPIQSNNSELEYSYIDNTLTEQSSVNQINQYIVENLKKEQVEESSSDTPLSMEVFNENEYSEYIETPIMSLDIMNKLMDGNPSPDDVTFFLENLNNNDVTSASSQEKESSINIIPTPPNSDEIESSSIDLQRNIFPLVNLALTDIETYNFLSGVDTSQFLPAVDSSNDTIKLPESTSSNKTNLLTSSPISSITPTTETITINTDASNAAQSPINNMYNNYSNKKVIVEHVKQYPVVTRTLSTCNGTIKTERPFSELIKVENENRPDNPITHNGISKTGIRRVTYTKVKAPGKKTNSNLTSSGRVVKKEEMINSTLETLPSSIIDGGSPRTSTDNVEGLKGEIHKSVKVESPEKDVIHKNENLNALSQEIGEKTAVNNGTPSLQSNSNPFQNVENGGTCPKKLHNATALKKQNESFEKQPTTEVSSQEFDMTDKFSVVKLLKRASRTKTLSQSVTSNEDNIKTTSSRSRSKSKNQKPPKLNVTTTESIGKSRGKRTLPLQEDSSNDSYASKKAKKSSTNKKQQSQIYTDTSDKNMSSGESSKGSSPVYRLNQFDTENYLKLTLKRLYDTDTVPNKKRKLNVQRPQDMDIIFNRLLQEGDVNTFVKTKTEASSSSKSLCNNSNADSKSKHTPSSSQETVIKTDNKRQLTSERLGNKGDSSIPEKYPSTTGDIMNEKNRRDPSIPKTHTSLEEKNASNRRDTTSSSRYHSPSVNPSELDARNRSKTRTSSEEKNTTSRRDISGSRTHYLHNSGSEEKIRRESSVPKNYYSANKVRSWESDEKSRRDPYGSKGHSSSSSAAYNLGIDERCKRESSLPKGYYGGTTSDPLRSSVSNRRDSGSTKTYLTANTSHTSSLDERIKSESSAIPKNHPSGSSLHSLGLDERIRRELSVSKQNHPTDPLRNSVPFDKLKCGDPNFPKRQGHVSLDPTRNSSGSEDKTRRDSNVPKSYSSTPDPTRNCYPQRDDNLSHRSHPSNKNRYFLTQIDMDKNRANRKSSSYNGNSSRYHSPYNHADQQKHPKYNGISGSSRSSASNSRPYDREPRTDPGLSSSNGPQSRLDSNYTNCQKDDPKYCYLTNVRLGKPQKSHASSRNHSIWLSFSSLLPEPKVSFDPEPAETTKNKEAKKS